MRRAEQTGVTLVEMMVVISIIGLIAAIAFPSLNSGLDSVRLTAATNSIASFLNTAMNRADRRQQMMEIAVSTVDHTLTMRSTEPGFLRVLAMPEGITVVRVLPEIADAGEQSVRLLYIYPAGSTPAIGIEIANLRGKHRIVRLDPVSGVPMIEDPAVP